MSGQDGWPTPLRPCCNLAHACRPTAAALPVPVSLVQVLASCLLTQIDYLNKALDLFNTAIVSPIYYVMFTLLSIIASVIMFQVRGNSVMVFGWIVGSWTLIGSRLLFKAVGSCFQTTRLCNPSETLHVAPARTNTRTCVYTHTTQQACANAHTHTRVSAPTPPICIL